MTKSNASEKYFVITSLMDDKLNRLCEIEIDEENRFVVELNGRHVSMFREHRMSKARIDELRRASAGTDTYREEDYQNFADWQSHYDEIVSFPIEHVKDVIFALQRADKIKTLV